MVDLKYCVGKKLLWDVLDLEKFCFAILQWD
jgi:hypothetical protein